MVFNSLACSKLDCIYSLNAVSISSIMLFVIYSVLYFLNNLKWALNSSLLLSCLYKSNNVFSSSSGASPKLLHWRNVQMLAWYSLHLHSGAKIDYLTIVFVFCNPVYAWNSLYKLIRSLISLSRNSVWSLGSSKPVWSLSTTMIKPFFANLSFAILAFRSDHRLAV